MIRSFQHQLTVILRLDVVNNFGDSAPAAIIQRDMRPACEPQYCKICATDVGIGPLNTRGVGGVVKFRFLVKWRLADVLRSQIKRHAVQAIFGHFIVFTAVFQCVRR